MMAISGCIWTKPHVVPQYIDTAHPRCPLIFLTARRVDQTIQSHTHTHTLTHTHTHTHREKEKAKLGCKQVERKITPWDSINITGMDRSKKRKYNQRSFLFLMGPHSGRRESTLTLMFSSFDDLCNLHTSI